MPPVRNTPAPTNIRLQPTSDGVNIKADVPRGSRIQVVNLSATAGAAQPGVVFSRTDGGKLNGRLTGLTEGDFLKISVVDGNGRVGNWLTVRAQGLGSDTRSARLNLEKVALTDLGERRVGIAGAQAELPVSEPRAWLQVENQRTGDVARVKLDGLGRIPPNFSVKGLPGDTFSFSISDGKNNADHRTTAGQLTLSGTITPAAIPEPKPHPDRIDPGPDGTMGVKRFGGPLFRDGARPTDVKQGSLGDCYVCAAASALANARPELLEKAIVANGDGSYDVTFKTYDAASRSFKDQTVTVDGDLYVRTNGTPMYGKAMGELGQENMELWFSVFEKAYAQWKGGYDVVGKGGAAAQVMADVLGTRALYQGIAENPDAAWTTIKNAIDAKRPIVVSTHGKDQAALYTNTGIYANHAYTVMGYSEENGQRFVELRNPWGSSEPVGDGENDGVFKLPLEELARLYKKINTVQ